MPRYVYASPIVPGKTEWIKALCQERTQKDYEAASEQQKREFWQFLGIEHWTAWLQYTEGRDYFIHCIEGDSLERISAGLRKKIAEKHPVACWIRDFYEEGLGKDYSDPGSQAQIEQVMDLELDFELLPGSQVIARAFVYPILPGKTAAHMEFCRSCTQEKRETFEESLRAFGVRRITKFMQRMDRQDLVVYYQEVDLERCRNFQLQEPHKTFAPFQWVSETLEEHTGMNYEQRKPHLEFLISASPESVALAGASC